MAQADLVVANQSGAAFRADLNNQLLALGTLQSGTAQPSTTYAYQWWADTTTGLLKIRNAANNAWITVGTLASTNLGLFSQAGGTLTGTLIVLNQGNFSAIEIGSGTATNQSAYIDLVGDTTYTDYGLRILRGNSGANAGSVITQRGTGELSIQTTEAAPLTFYTTNIDRGRVDPSGRFLIGTNTASGSALLQVAGDAQIQSLNGGPLAGFRNRIINGNFDFWQRGTSFTTGFGADRWNNADSGTTHAVTRQAFALGQTAVPNEPTYFNRTVVTSVAGAGNLSQLLQPIEDVRTFAGQQVTVSFWAKVDSTKNIAVELVQDFGTGGSPSSQVRAIGTTKVSIGTSWQKVTVTATVPSISGKTLGTNGNSYLALIFWFDAGSNWNTSTNSLGQQSGTFEIAQVQVEPGAVATPFEQRPIGAELALCQRYFCSTIFNNRFNAATGGNINESSIYWPAQMRAAPTVTLNTTGIVNATALASSPTVNGARSELVAVAAGDARLLMAPVTASAEL